MEQLSEHQTAFKQAVWNLARGQQVQGAWHLVLQAVAGSGKTFSITHAVEAIPTNQRVLVLMFAKKNAIDMQAKLPTFGKIQSKTTHAFGGQVLRRNRAGVLVESKMNDVLNEMQLPPGQRSVFTQILKLCGIAKAIGLVPEGYHGARGLVDDTPELWADLVDYYAVEFEQPWQEELAISTARDALRLSLDAFSIAIDYDDMLYMPVVMDLVFPKFDWVFVDEAQDINAVQREMVKRALRTNGHLVAVGDPNQAIYGFRGADCESMQRIELEMCAARLPLSICYRCDREIVREAQELVPEIQWHDARPDGEVSLGLDGTRAEKLALFTPDSVILCPRNAPLVSAAFGFIRRKIACHMLGRAFAEGLVKLLEKLEATTAQDAEQKLDTYLEMELPRLRDKENQRLTLLEKAATLRVFLEESPAQTRVEKIKREIDNLFDEDKKAGKLTLSSIHKAKGAEWPRVFLLDADSLLSPTVSSLGQLRELQGWEVQQRRNLLYVAITRAEHELIYLSSDEMEQLLR